MIFRKKKRTNFLFLLINRFFYLSLSGGWTQKVGGTNDSPSPPLKKVGGTVSPRSYAHVRSNLYLFRNRRYFSRKNYNLISILSEKNIFIMGLSIRTINSLIVVIFAVKRKRVRQQLIAQKYVSGIPTNFSNFLYILLQKTILTAFDSRYTSIAHR